MRATRIVFWIYLVGSLGAMLTFSVIALAGR
jgi:hypothetical protein